MFLGYIDPGTGYTIFTMGSWFIAFALGFLGVFSFFFKKIFGYILEHKIIAVIIISIVILLCLIIIMAVSARKTGFDKKIVILGLDGLSPKIMEPMMKNGELPNFSKLKEQGSYKHISTTNPSQSPVAWAGFATGQNPGKNDVFDFIVRDPKDYRLSLSLSNIKFGRPQRIIKSKCFWQYTSEEKVPTFVIGCPVTFPPDRIHGKMISGMGVPDILGTEGTFTFYTSEKLDSAKDTGGNAFHVNRSKVMVLDLIGPKVSKGFGRPENTKVPFKVTLLEDKDRVIIEYRDNKFELKKGEWSGWKNVVFSLGFLKKANGIFKFYLVEAKPGFKLYISPVNFDPRSPFFAISYPGNYSRELAEGIGLFHTQGMPADTWAVNEKRLTEDPLLLQIEEIYKEKKAMLDLELGRFEKGVLFCYVETPDTIQHMFWRYTDPEHPLYEKDAPAEYKNMIKTWYKKMDGLLGEVMKKVGSDDTLIALSDHGFDTFRRAVHVNTWLRDKGYLELKDPYAPSGAELLSDIDWGRTRAYAIGFGAIYMNQEGREKEGIVKPGKETEDLKKEIADELKEWTDKKHSRPVISRVYKNEEIFRGGYAKEAPDLYIGFNTGYRASWQTALGAVPEGSIDDNLKKWSGDHLFDPALIPGVLFTNKKIIKDKTSIYDITPTIVKLIGFDEEKIRSCDFDGKPLF